MMRVLFLFLDGVGLGEDDPERNPFLNARMPHLQGLLGGQMPLRERGRIEAERATLIPTDALLGVPGLPQSATGQTALLTGVNAARVLGRHWGPWPDATLRGLLERKSVFKQVADLGRRPYFANAYPQRYFDELDRGRRLSAVPLAAQAAGLELLLYPALKAGRALSADFTNEGWRDFLGYTDVPLLSLEEAGATLVHLAGEHDFTLYEYWPLDLLGHRGTMAQAVEALERFDAFLGGILEAMDDGEMLLVLTSDHGNLEDLGTRGHTRNPVPTLLVGVGREAAAQQIRDLSHIAPALVEALAESKRG
ncbi:MAG: hypothetical protein ACE5MB_10535 [Anaerolineae bacterium]